MKVNFPNLAKEINFHEVQEAQRVPKKLDPRRNTPKHIIITLPKVENKERESYCKGHIDKTKGESRSKVRRWVWLG